MSQQELQLPEGAATSSKFRKARPGTSSPEDLQPFYPRSLPGPNGVLRGKLLRANHEILLREETGQLSQVSLEGLAIAVNGFLRDLGVLGSAFRPGQPHSTSGAGSPRSGKKSQSVKTRTRNFKS